MKTILKLFTVVSLILCLLSCEEIVSALNGGLVIQEPDSGDIIAQNWVEVKVKCYEGEIVRVECEGNTQYVDCYESDDYAYFDVYLSEGSNEITVRGYDFSGFVEDSDSVTVKCDTIAPVIAVNSPADGSIINLSQLPIVIRGTVADANGVVSLAYRGDNGLFGSLAVSHESWVLPVNSAILKDETTYSFEFIAEDTAGRTRIETYAFRYDSDYVHPP
jgi:hypothetical protein